MFLNKKMKKKNKKKIIYHEPPMKYNIALHKFEPDLPTIEKGYIKNQLQTIPLTIVVVIMIIAMVIIIYLRSQLY